LDRFPIAAGDIYSNGETGGAVSNSASVTIVDPGHTHTQNPHTHTMANHTHTTPNHIHALGTTVQAAGGSLGGGYISPGSPMAIRSGAIGSMPCVNDTTVSGGAGTSGTPSTNTSDATTATENSNTTGISASTTVATLPPFFGVFRHIRVL